MSGGFRCACGRGLNGANECCCAGCAAAGRPAHFSSVHAFDAHWVGTGDDRRCVNPASLIRKDGNPRLSEVVRASGNVWTVWHAEEHPFVRLAAVRRAASGIGGER